MWQTLKQKQEIIDIILGSNINGSKENETELLIQKILDCEL